MYIISINQTNMAIKIIKYSSDSPFELKVKYK